MASNTVSFVRYEFEINTARSAADIMYTGIQLPLLFGLVTLEGT
jgi:hypothetical protein